MSEEKPIISLACSLVVPLFHIQYIVASTVLMIYTAGKIVAKKLKLPALNINKMHIAVFVVILVLLMVGSLRSLPSVIGLFNPALSTRAAVKLNYLNSSVDGLRLTSILTLLVAIIPLTFSRFSSNLHPSLFRYLNIFTSFPVLAFLSLTSACFQIVFYNFPHVAGRLSRASDYILIPIFVACLLPPPIKKDFFSTSIIIVILTLSSMIIYRSVYFSTPQ